MGEGRSLIHYYPSPCGDSYTQEEEVWNTTASFMFHSELSGCRRASDGD
ncbi:hypothetical protein Nmel_015321 [Mimus melanotis]